MTDLDTKQKKSMGSSSTGGGILYFMGAWSVGGVERVTAVLANEWIRRGRRVVIFAFNCENDLLLTELDRRVVVVMPNVGVMTDASAKALRKAIEDNEVSYIINDWSLPFKTTLFLRKVCHGLRVSQLVNLHNIPNTNARIAAAKNPILKFAIRIVSALNMHLTYVFCKKYVLLSESFKPIFRRFAFVPFGRKLAAIANPLTVEMSNERFNKENVLLYAGRLEEKQKCFSRIANLWKNRLANEFPDWRLDVVGDGQDRLVYEKMLSQSERVTFHGYQNPTMFYRRSKMLLLTSDFEGFPLVLAEAMSAGCVPVVLGSFSAVYDIIDYECGKIVEMPYDELRFSENVISLMRDKNALESFSEKARYRAHNFAVESIVDQWENLLKKL